MAIDPNIPLAAGQIGGDQENALSNLLGIRGQMIQQRAYQQLYDANVAQSSAIKQSIDPVTGQPDYNKAAAIMANDPRAAYNLPQFMGQVAEQKSKALQQQTQQFDLASKQVNWLKGGLGSMLNNPNTTPQDVMKFAANGINQGFLTPEQAANELSSMPQDPAQLQAWIRQHYIQSLNGEAQLQAVRPNTQILNTGGQQQVLNVDPITGMPTIAGAVANTMSPEAASTPTQVYNPRTGQMEVISRQQFANTLGGPTPNGRYPGSPGTGYAAGPALGQQAGMEAAAKGGAERFNALQSDAGGVRNTVAGYDAALNALAQLGKSGPGVAPTMLITSTMESLGLPVNKDDNANWQALNKYLANAGAQAAASAGYGGSDAGRAIFGEGQPSAQKMNPEALQGAIQYVKAQNLGVLAKQSAAQNFIDQNGGDYTKYSQFENKWNKAYSPDAMYMNSLQDPQAQAKFYNSLPAAKQQALRKSYNEMAALGAF